MVEREFTPRLTLVNSFLDFYCSSCRGFVRVYYWNQEPEERVHYGWVELRTVVEGRSVAEPC